MDIRYTWVVTVTRAHSSTAYIAGRSRTYPFASNYVHPSDKLSPVFEHKLTPGVGLGDCTVLPQSEHVSIRHHTSPCVRVCPPFLLGTSSAQRFDLVYWKIKMGIMKFLHILSFLCAELTYYSLLRVSSVIQPLFYCPKPGHLECVSKYS